MNESSLPKLTESKEKVKQKIQERITRGEELLGTLENPIEEYGTDLVDKCSKWSRYNETLLITLFSEGSGSYGYILFPSRGGLVYVPKHFITLERMKRSINSLKEIYEHLDLYEEYSESTNTTQHEFGNEVFIVHGRDDGAKDSVARVVSEDLELKPIILHEQPDKGNTVIEKLERCSSNVGYAIALVTPDDIGALKDKEDDELNPRARQNVVFELGYFMGKLGRDRVCLLLKDQVELPSDIGGIVYISMDPNDGWKTRLQRNIRAVIKEELHE